MNVSIVDEVELSMLEAVDKLLSEMKPSLVNLVLARIHGNSGMMSDDSAWDLFGLWSEASPNGRKLIAKAMAVRLQGGSYRKELYKAWGEYKSLPQEKMDQILQQIKH